MKMNEKMWTKIRWTTRIIASIVFIFGILFYFGYGNPLPFINQDYTFFDNLWLSAFPLIFLGLLLGLKWEKIGGYLIIIPLIIAFLIGLIILREGLPGPMYIPLIIGIAYLILGYNSKKKNKTKRR